MNADSATAVASNDSTDVLSRITDRIHEVSSLPHVMIQVLEVVNNPETSVADLKDVVENDPALMARVIRTVNSAAYGLRVRVESVHRAISFLGFNEVRDLAVTASVADIFGKEIEVRTYRRRDLWRHLVCVALGARLIASRARIDRFEEAYLSGLLHDLGIILTDQYLHSLFLKILEEVADDSPLCAIERRHLGFDHTELGSRVAENWRFPDHAVATIRFHHNSDKCPPAHQAIVQAVEVANFLCTSKRISSMGVQNVPPPPHSAFDALSIRRNDLKVLWADLDKELAKAEELIKI